MTGELKVFGGNSNPALAEKIYSFLGINKCEIDVSTFADGEIYVKINENVRGTDCFVLQSTCPPVNRNLMELLIIIDALRRASADRITAVIPYFGYGRQDRKDSPRVPITAKLVANLITEAGAHRVLGIDFHVDQIQGFFDIPVDHLFAAPVFMQYLKNKVDDDFTFIAPDTGSIGRTSWIAKRLHLGLAVVDKRRQKKNIAKVYNIIGDIKGYNVIIYDDIVDTAGTLTKVAKELEVQGANKIWAACVHPVLSRDAVKNIEDSPIEKILITDTIKHDNIGSNKFEVLSVAELLGQAIDSIHNNTSVSSLFKD